MNNKLNKEIQSIKQLVSEMPDVITSEMSDSTIREVHKTLAKIMEHCGGTIVQGYRAGLFERG